MNEISPFRVEKREKVAWLILNRPKKLNTMNPAFFKELHHYFKEFDADRDVSVVVIRAEGNSFTAGLDLLEITPIIQGSGVDFKEGLRRTLIGYEDSVTAIEKCSKPVIAAVHSHCMGGGVGLMSACDIRMASEDAVFSIRQTRIAYIPDLGIIQRLPYIIGHGWFRELALTGRDFSAQEALKMGFITRLCKDRDALYSEAHKLASEIADLPPLTVQGAKDVILYSREHGVDAGIKYLAQKHAHHLPSEDLMEASEAFLQKRKPIFKGK